MKFFGKPKYLSKDEIALEKTSLFSDKKYTYTKFAVNIFRSQDEQKPKEMPKLNFIKSLILVGLKILIATGNIKYKAGKNKKLKKFSKKPNKKDERKIFLFLLSNKKELDVANKIKTV